MTNKTEIGHLTDYIKDNLQHINGNKEGQSPWMVTHQQDGIPKTQQGIQIIDNKRNRISTYADVLRRRFGGKPKWGEGADTPKTAKYPSEKKRLPT